MSKDSRLPLDELNRITVEVGCGKPPAKPDTPAMKRARESIEKDFEAARARGAQIQLPNE
ncbi:MAG TPA: hypothetical protein VMT89_02040 [Candidatus Acidoferrales bacterium]|nr:hypothetical protein [Candidatus Acidoferrales bacterium]